MHVEAAADAHIHTAAVAADPLVGFVFGDGASIHVEGAARHIHAAAVAGSVLGDGAPIHAEGGSGSHIYGAAIPVGSGRSAVAPGDAAAAGAVMQSKGGFRFGVAVDDDVVPVQIHRMSAQAERDLAVDNDIVLHLDVARQDVFPPGKRVHVSAQLRPARVVAGAVSLCRRSRHRQQGQHHTHHKQQAKPLSPLVFRPLCSHLQSSLFFRKQPHFSGRFPAALLRAEKLPFLRPEARGAPDPSPGLSCGRRHLPYPLWKGPLTDAFIRCYLKKQQGSP